MDFVVPIINFVRSKALFHALLEEVGNQFTDLVKFTSVRWLSWGKELKRFYECLKEVITFLTCKNYNAEHLQLLSNLEWIQKFISFFC